jgi:regulator of replication initiation timing
MDNTETDIINHYKSSLSRAFTSSRLDHEKIEKLLEENKKLIKENEHLKRHIEMLSYVINPDRKDN